MKDLIKQVDDILNAWGGDNFITESDQNDVRRDLRTLRAALAATPSSLVGVGEAAAPATEWVIVSMVEGRGKPYWRPNSAGYTDSICDAGKYSYAEARSITSGCHGDAEKYCTDDPALYDLITYQNLARGKEIKLYLENAALKARLAAAAPSLGEGAALAGWVSIADRLPEFGVDVLLLYNNQAGKGRQTVGKLAQFGLDDWAAEPQNVWLNNYEPTHWQPLLPLPTAPAAAPSEKGASHD